MGTLAKSCGRNSIIFKSIQRRVTQSFLTAIPICKLQLHTTRVPTMTTISSPTSASPVTKSVTEAQAPAQVQKPMLTMAILRYTPGEERFQFTFKFHDKLFNFSRPISETMQSFSERAKANVAKKVKRFDPTSPIQVKNSDSEQLNDGTEAVFSSIFNSEQNPDFHNAKLTFQIGQETIRVDVNPPEVIKIKFFKQVMPGFPILPISMEGSPNFSAEQSKFKWEFATADDVSASHKKHLRKKSESEREIWSPCGFTIKRGQIFTPDESFLGSVLRLTCQPSNLTGNRFGYLHSEETPTITAPPTCKFLFEERLSRMEEKSSDPNFFRVISYNTLSDPCATPEWFTASPPESLPMDYRLPLLNRELKSYQGDIVCMQEVDKKFFGAYFKPYLSQECGLEGIICCKTGLKTNKEGVAMFFNPTKFELVETNSIILHEQMQTLPFFKSISSEQLLEKLSERSTVLQVCVFKSLASPDTLLVVANTHLYFHPTADHIRLLQTITSVNYVESKVQELRAKFPTLKITVLFCGDLNCTPPFGSLRYLTSGTVCQHDEDWTSNEAEKLVPGIEMNHQLKLTNSLPNNELTNIVAKFEGCIDYILYQQDFVQLLKSYPPPSKVKIAEFCGLWSETRVALPNFQAPSDHLPIIADFVLRKL